MNARLSLILGVVLLTACGTAQSPRNSADATTAPALIESRGIVMPLRQARANIAFTPVIPPGRLLASAAIPPLGGTDSKRTHGIALEYENTGARFLLSQWRRNGLTIDLLGFDADHRPCAPVVLRRPVTRGTITGQGLLWTTRNGLVMTLQPDGAVSGSRLASESKGLLTASGCRRP